MVVRAAGGHRRAARRRRRHRQARARVRSARPRCARRGGLGHRRVSRQVGGPAVRVRRGGELVSWGFRGSTAGIIPGQTDGVTRTNSCPTTRAGPRQLKPALGGNYKSGLRIADIRMSQAPNARWCPDERSLRAFGICS